MGRRMRMVRFRFTPPRPDPNLGNKLRNEAPGVLRWKLAGCLERQKDGLPESGAVSDATRKYFVESDIVGQWMEECCETARNAETSVSELWASYDQWCEANVERSAIKQAK